MKFKEFLQTKSITLDEFGKKEVAEQAKLYTEYQEKLAEDLQSKIDGKADKKTVEEAKATLEYINELGVDKFKALVSEHIEAMKTIKALQEKPANEKSYKTIEEAITAAYKEKKKEIDALISAPGEQKAPVGITIKTADVITTESTIGSGSTQYTLTQNTGIISTLRKRELTYAAQVSVGSIGTQRALWVEEQNEDGTPVFIGEGDTKTILDVEYVEKTESVKKIAVYGKVTMEMLADLPQLISYIKNNLMKRLDIKVEDKLVSAVGAGDDPKGAKYYATAFTGGSLAGTVASANELDVFEAIAMQCKEAYGIPNACMVHPSTVGAIKLIKDTTGRPVWKDYVTIDGNLKISGMTIVESNAITAGEFLGGDMSVLNLLYREELGIVIGLNGNDFIENKKTMLCEKRLVQFVSANDTQVLIKGDFTTAKAALAIA